MKFPKQYKVLRQNTYIQDEYSIVPIRYEDRLEIMKWRNEQIFHLRQADPLTEHKQNNYFNTIVQDLFEQAKPHNLLFSFLKGDECIGYGGLVHINWVDKHAEISFILETDLQELFFERLWTIYLKLIEQVAFIELKFHKLFVYAFDLRPHLYDVLQKNNYFLDAVLKDHCLFEGNFIDVVIHSKIKG